MLDETVIDSHGGDVNLVILSLGIRKCQFKFWDMINAYLACDWKFTVGGPHGLLFEEFLGNFSGIFSDRA